jgi:NifU-like protein involved in Fe-S cluster formation
MSTTGIAAGHAGDKDAAKEDASYFGRMNGPTACSILKGPCGDEMEFYLYIRDDIIEDVRYFTEGCGHTKTCALAVAKRARGHSVMDALAISPREIVDSRECLPEEGRHCAILAVSTLYRAIANYLLNP